MVRPELHPISVKAPWHQLGIDFVGPLAIPSPTGNWYILTCSDYCNKWVEAFATPDKSARQTASALFKNMLLSYIVIVILLSFQKIITYRNSGN